MTYDTDYYPHLHLISLVERLKDLSGNDVSDEYDPRQLMLLSRHQITFWDKTHPKVEYLNSFR